MFRHLEDGTSTAVAIGGRGGFVGLSVITDRSQEETEIRVLIPGVALAMPAAVLAQIAATVPAIREALLKFNSMLLAQVSVSLSCMAHHSLDHRLARWLLTAGDRAGEADLGLRQEDLALVLAVRRTGVSEAVGRLVAAGVVEQHRGHIIILQPERLAARSCDCFVEAEAARRRSAPDVATSAPLGSAHIAQLVERFQRGDLAGT